MQINPTPSRPSHEILSVPVQPPKSQSAPVPLTAPQDIAALPTAADLAPASATTRPDQIPTAEDAANVFDADRLADAVRRLLEDLPE